ncbi:MAG: PAS domain S-box protein [Desulfobulbaceae bacterium]|nr:PAS domain S-box protein [Desulfobulbaceae bacterium]
MSYKSITKQATQRLVFSLALFVVVVSISTALFYHHILNKANSERAADMEHFFHERLIEIGRDWELQSSDFRVRLEVTRLLEDPATPDAVLQAFMTVQGTNRRFQHLMIEDRQGNQIFNFGKSLDLDQIPLTEYRESDWFQDPVTGGLYRVIVQPIWLGANGMGRIALFFQLNNASLQQMAAPSITLTALYHGTPVASSLGQQGIEKFLLGHTDKFVEYEHRELSWSGRPDDLTRLHIQAPIKNLFTTVELALSVAFIPIIDGLILWLALGTWLMRNSRRITHLGDAVTIFSRRHELDLALSGSLIEARAGQNDEICQVAEALDELTKQSVVREEKIRSLFDNSADAVIIHNVAGKILQANLTFLQRYGYNPAELSFISLQDIEFSNNSCSIEKCNDKLFAEGTGICEVIHRSKIGKEFPVEVNSSVIQQGEERLILSTCRDVTERRKAAEDLARKNVELQEALDNVRTLSGLLPICASCKNIRDDKGYWRQIESYIMKHTDTQFTHGICPDCMTKLYPEVGKERK